MVALQTAIVAGSAAAIDRSERDKVAFCSNQTGFRA